MFTARTGILRIKVTPDISQIFYNFREILPKFCETFTCKANKQLCSGLKFLNLCPINFRMQKVAQTVCCVTRSNSEKALLPQPRRVVGRNK
jgi:hypothetical protein